MLANINAIFTDSEGTLRDENRHITEETIAAIDELNKKGVFLIITSGLPRFLIRKVQSKSHASGIVICSNGADIYDIEHEMRIASSFIDQRVLYELWKEYHDTFTFILGKGDTEYASDVSEYNQNPTFINDENIHDDFFQCHISQKRIINGDSVGRELNTLRRVTSYDIERALGKELMYKLYHSDSLTNEETEILIRLKRFIELEKAQNEILAGYQGAVVLANQSRDFAMFQHVGEIPWFSLNNSDVSKGNGIRIVSNYLGIPKEAIISIGNDHNDISMIDASGIFICPSNSSEEVLAKSDYAYNAKEGFDKALRKVLSDYE